MGFSIQKKELILKKMLKGIIKHVETLYWCCLEGEQRDQQARKLVYVITCCSAICFRRSSSARSCSDVLSIMLFPPTSNLLSII